MPNPSALITRTRTDLSGVTCGAVFSPCESYRYSLAWTWDKTKPPLTFCLLNPSTADHEKLDPTATGLITRARLWGYGGVDLLNLFAYRATDPQAMLAQPDPVGPHNEIMTRAALSQAQSEGGPVICGWGKHGTHRGQDKVFCALAADMDVPLMALERNQDGTPRHPLYIAHNVRPAFMD